jgi:predicted transcriptional regulator
MMKAKAQLTVGILSLVALLIYTLAHTGALLSQYVRPPIIGYIAAFGIEAAIVSLSLRIGELKKSQQSATFFYFVLVATVVTSAVANVAEGFYTLYGEHLTINSVSQLDFAQAGIGVTATGLISLIVLALSEIVGTDVTQTAKQLERERNQKVSQATINVTNSTSFEATPEAAERARQAKMLQDIETKEQRREVIVTVLSNKPDTDVTDLARVAGVTRQTIYRDLNELVTAGVISKNGEGYKVTR